jgi:cobalamin biosynthesis protein CobW
MSLGRHAARTPVTIITGFLGAGKTTLVRHLLEHAGGRRLAVIVNEFGQQGVDGETLKSCSVVGCAEVDIVELANGCLCCTVADDLVPTIEALMARTQPPEHILIETSGLALPKPLLKAFGWPSVRSRLTVDGVIAVIDGPAVAAGRFADDPEAVAAQRALDPSVDHDNPLAEVYEDQLSAADLVILNKTDLLGPDEVAEVSRQVAAVLPRAVKVALAREGKVDLAALLGLQAGAENNLEARPSHHDGAEDHEHDDFESFVVAVPEIAEAEAFVARLRPLVEGHEILRVKGFLAVAGKPMRLEVQGVGPRFRQQFDRPWAGDEARRGHLVVIGRAGLDRSAIEAGILG